MDGYGNDTTAQPDNTASAIAQIFSTGVTAYVDSQAIQNGYQINNPTMYQSGYPGGIGTSYTPTSAGASVTSGGSSSLLLLGVVVVGLFLLLKK